MPKFQIIVETKYEDNCGETENVKFFVIFCNLNQIFISIYQKKSHNLCPEELTLRTIDFIDIVSEPIPEHKYKESEGWVNDFLLLIGF